MNIRKNGVIARILLTFAALLGALLSVPSHAVRVSTTGMGQVLLFPYYTVQNDNVSLISLVNTTTQGKGVRVNLRDARGGFVIGQLNVYLSAKDVWTAAIVGTGGDVRLISNDRSCTAPSIYNVATGLPLTRLPPGGTGLEPSRSESRREGYVEVIEMATISNNTPTGISITHVNGIAQCNRSITDAAFEPPIADLKAPSGGLTGTLSIVNVGQGMLVSTAATALENFWLTGPGAAVPRVWPANTVGPGLDTGGDKEAYLHGTVSNNTPGSPTVIARFATSLDAVSAVLMTSSAYTEYAATGDGTIATTAVITMPTKPYYIRRSDVTPFQSLLDDATRQSCDDIVSVPYDREESTASTPDDFATPPARRRNQLCYVANAVSIYSALGDTSVRFQFEARDASLLDAQFAVGVAGLQYGGRGVDTPGREGGWLELVFASPTSSLTPSDASTVSINNGKPEITKITGTLIGLPVIGFTLSQAAYRTGSPQQNYADAIPLRTQNTIFTTAVTIP